MKDAVEMHQAGRIKEAERLYLQYLEGDPDNADALRLLGVVRHQLGDPDDAARLINRAIDMDPGNAKAYDNLGFVHVAQGNLAEASASYAKAAALNPSDEITHHNLGRVLYRQHRLDDAVASYRRTLEINPGNADASLDLAAALVDQKSFDQAIEAYRKAISVDPGRHSAYGGLAGTLLANDEPEAALAACDEGLARRPYDTLAWALKAVALAELGDADGARRIQDFDGLVHRAFLPPPDGYETIQGFNADLARHLIAHPTRRLSPDDNATRNGWHTRDISGDDAPCIKTMRSVIQGAVEDYLAWGRSQSNHVFFEHVPEEIDLEMWGIVMESGGYQTSHAHPGGWLSGVYYVSLPDDLGPDETQPTGWIQFGEARDDLYHRTTPVRNLVRPAEGLLVLFPSFFWHSTIPTHTHLERVSLAFDIQRVR